MYRFIKTIIIINFILNFHSTHSFAQEFISLKEIDQKYQQYIKNDRIIDLKKFNENGKFLIFEIPNGGIKKYLIFQRTKDQKLKAYYWSTLRNLSATKNCYTNILQIHIDPKLFIAGFVEKIIPSDFPEHYKTNEHNRIDIRIQNCEVIYYGKYYARIIDELLK